MYSKNVYVTWLFLRYSNKVTLFFKLKRAQSACVFPTGLGDMAKKCYFILIDVDNYHKWMGVEEGGSRTLEC